jgi:Na+/H+-dicarboxylate symporter
MIRYYKRVPLWGKILIGLVLGVIAGIIFKQNSLYLKPVGTIFINSVKMLIVPLVFSSLIVGFTSVEDLGKMGRIGLKTIIVYAVTTAFAVIIGMGLSYIVNPGSGISLTASKAVSVAKPNSLIDTLVNVVPSNPVASLANGEILQIIVFALFLGIAINLTGKKAEPVKNFFIALAEVMYKLTAIIMEFAPYGVFALIACVVGEYGIEFLLPLLKIILVVYVACAIHTALIICGGIALVGKLHPGKFLKGFLDAALVAFSASSSSAALPVSLRCTQENLGVSKGISSFVLPLGCTINMNGTALYSGACALFVAQIYGIDLTFSNYVTIILTSVLAAIGTAGVPGAGLVMLSLVIASTGMPMEGLAIIAGVDRILDMARSCVNVVGDGMASILVAKSENELDLSVYNSKLTESFAQVNSDV